MINRVATTCNRTMLVRKSMVLLSTPALDPAVAASQSSMLQYRNFSSRRNFKKRKGANPFKVLGVSEEAKYAVVKKKFLKIAMSNHPDTADVESEEDRDKLRDIFISARIAFEQLVEAPDGSIVLKEEAELMPDFDDWFQQETGHKNPFDVDMDPQTMKEVAEMTETVGGGLDRDGGMWQLAKMVTNAVNAGGDAASMLKLEAGELNSHNRQLNGKLRRRRRKK
jgi:hypothetical protein